MKTTMYQNFSFETFIFGGKILNIYFNSRVLICSL